MTTIAHNIHLFFTPSFAYFIVPLGFLFQKKIRKGLSELVEEWADQVEGFENSET